MDLMSFNAIRTVSLSMWYVSLWSHEFKIANAKIDIFDTAQTRKLRKQTKKKKKSGKSRRNQAIQYYDTLDIFKTNVWSISYRDVFVHRRRLKLEINIGVFLITRQYESHLFTPHVI